MFDIIINRKKDKFMTDIADNVIATLEAVKALTAQVSVQDAKIDALTATVAAIQTPTVDLQPVLDAIAAESAKLEPTPTAPEAAPTAPDSAPETPAA